jgi:hypothetical protein
MTVNDEVHGLATPAAALEIVASIREKEAAHAAN